ncbi:MAG: tyrosine-type recombinase/integrase [Planctomycetaceae bacterium]
MRKPFFKKSHKSWYVHHQGRMQKLGPDKDEAFRRYHELMADDAPVSDGDRVATLANAYLEWCQKNRSAQTYDFYQKFISSFIRSTGVKLLIGNLKPFHVTNWLDSQKRWNDTTKHNAVRAVKRVFNWAVRDGRLQKSPLLTVERPTPRRREVFVSVDQFELILKQVADQQFRDYLQFLSETGARPQEAKLVEARHCELDAARIVLPASDAKGKRFPRVIYLTEAACRLVARICQEQPDGPLLRNMDGNPWTKDSVNCRFRRLRARLEKAETPIPGLCATAVRHGFATTALKNGVDPVTVSILMGHADASQVAKTYQHLAVDSEFLRNSIAKARGRRQTS